MEITFHQVVHITVEECQGGNSHWKELVVKERGKDPVSITLFAADMKEQLKLHEVVE